MSLLAELRDDVEGSALLEFAIALPLLVVFVVGIYDFSGAYNEKQKIEHAAQSGASAAAGQPTGDMDPFFTTPDSLLPVVDVVFNSLASDNVLPQANQGSCKASSAVTTNAGLIWTYKIGGCPHELTITVNRGVFAAGQPTVGTAVTVSYPYHWKFNGVIQLVVPGAAYGQDTPLTETATVQNQM